MVPEEPVSGFTQANATLADDFSVAFATADLITSVSVLSIPVSLTGFDTEPVISDASLSSNAVFCPETEQAAIVPHRITMEADRTIADEQRERIRPRFSGLPIIFDWFLNSIP